MTRKRRISTRSLFTLSAAAILSLACLASTQATVRGGVDVATKRLLANQTYSSDYSSKQEAMEAGLAINEQIAEEGMVLLKNERNTLPLTTRSGSEATRVTLFGYASYAPQGGAEGGGDSSAGTVHLTSDIYSSLRSAGYVTNPAIRAFYEEKTAEGAAQATPTTPTDFTTVDELIKDTSITGTYNNYGDAAIVVFSIGNVADTSIQHKYQLDSKQMALLKHAEDNFDKVIVLINNSVPVEIGALKDDDKVDAILVVGQPGDNGFDAVGAFHRVFIVVENRQDDRVETVPRTQGRVHDVAAKREELEETFVLRDGGRVARDRKEVGDHHFVGTGILQNRKRREKSVDDADVHRFIVAAGLEQVLNFVDFFVVKAQVRRGHGKHPFGKRNRSILTK